MIQSSREQPVPPKEHYLFYYSREIINKTKDGRFYLPFTLFEYDKHKKTLSLRKYIDVETIFNSGSHVYYIPVNGGMMETTLVDSTTPNEPQHEKNKKYIGLKLSGTNSMVMYTHSDPYSVTSVELIGRTLATTTTISMYQRSNSTNDKSKMFVTNKINNLFITQSSSNVISQPGLYLVSFMTALGCMSFIYGCYIYVKDYMTPSKPYPSKTGQQLMEAVGKGEESL